MIIPYGHKYTPTSTTHATTTREKKETNCTNTYKPNKNSGRSLKENLTVQRWLRGNSRLRSEEDISLTVHTLRETRCIKCTNIHMASTRVTPRPLQNSPGNQLGGDTHLEPTRSKPSREVKRHRILVGGDIFLEYRS